MVFRMLAVVVVVALIQVRTAPVASAAGEPDGQRWWSHVLALADDRLEGRGTGTPGHRKAAEYVAREFERAGIKPAGTDGYLPACPPDCPRARRGALQPGARQGFGQRSTAGHGRDAVIMLASRAPGLARSRTGLRRIRSIDPRSSLR